MLKIHHLGLSQSERIVWLAEELEIPYEFCRYDREPSGLAPPEYKALHPTGSAPIVEDGPLVMAESGAIIEYIAHRHGGGRLMVDPSHPDFYQFLYWFNFANSSLGCNALVEVLVELGGAVADEAKSNTLTAVIDRVTMAYRMANDHLKSARWFAGGEFTTADIMMVFHFTTMRNFKHHDISGLPALRAYLGRIGERPAYQRAMAKCEPGMTPLLT